VITSITTISRLANTIRSGVTVFTIFRLLTDFVCLYTYEFWLSLCRIVRSSVILLLPLFLWNFVNNIYLQNTQIIVILMWFIFFWGYYVTNIKFVRFKIVFFFKHLKLYSHIWPPHKQAKSWCGLYTRTMFFLPRFWEQKGVWIMYHCG
jgi:hypothetical protein